MCTDPKNEEKQSEVVEPNASANPPACSDKEATTPKTDEQIDEKAPDEKEKSAASEKPSRPRYNNEVLQEAADDAVKSAEGSTDPRVAILVAAVKSCVEALPPGAAAIFTAEKAADDAAIAMTAPVATVRVSLARVAGVLKATARGRDYYASVRSTHPWVTAQSLLAGASTAGFGIPATLMSELTGTTAVAQAAVKAHTDAADAKVLAREDFKKARKNLRRAIRTLKACLAFQQLAQDAGSSPANPPTTIAGASGGAKAA